MTEAELIEFALSGWPPAVRERIVDDLKNNGPDHSVYGWHVHLGMIGGIWDRLDLSQKLVAYLAAEERASNLG